MNNIAFLFHHNKDDRWSTPLSVYNEFVARGWNATIYSTTSDSNVEQLLTTKPDVILHMDFGMYQSPLLADLKSTGAYCIMEAGDEPQRYNLNIQKVQYFDLILSPDYRTTRSYERQGFNAKWWTHFADTRMHMPMTVPIKYKAGCSRGLNNGATLIDKFTREDRFVINQAGWHAEQHTEFLNSCLIVLQQSRYGEITRRLFEGMACRKLVLADRLDPGTNVHNIFTENEHIVYYDSYEDLKEKVDYYSKNESERNRIATNAYNHVMANHTQINRVEDILKWMS